MAFPRPRKVLDRVDAAIRWRASETVDQAVAPVARRAQDLHDWVARVERTAEWSANELRRLAPQVAAIEARLADLDDLRRRDAVAGTDEQRTMLDMIAAEHERVRARLEAVASYEERLRRLES